MKKQILARFAGYTVRRGRNGKLYIAVYRKPHLIYSVDAFLNADLNIPKGIRNQARRAIVNLTNGGD